MGEYSSTWVNIVPPEHLDAMRATWTKGLKTWWEKAPQDQKDKLNDMIDTLKTPTKPKGKEWVDFEAWWNQLSDEEKEEVMARFMTSYSERVGMWTLKDASELTKWDSRISVIDQFPMFKNIPRESVSAGIRRVMDYSDERGGYSIIHVRV